MGRGAAPGSGGHWSTRAVEAARAAGVRGMYLLTTSAERYFPRFGFERITREDVPDPLHASVEFRGACPASAVIMRKIVELGGTGARFGGQGSVP